MQIFNFGKLATRWIGLICLAILLFNTSCNIGSKYHAPSMDNTQNWKNNANNNSEACYTDYWWEVFEDPLLNSLEQEVLVKNYDLKIAFNRAQEARGLMNAAKADLYPQLYLNPSYSNEHVLYESYSDGESFRLMSCFIYCLLI